jgi:hypothetical protein
MPAKTRVVVSRHWHQPHVEVKLVQGENHANRLELSISLEDFIRAIAHDLELRPDTFKERVLAVFSTPDALSVEDMLLASAKVLERIKHHGAEAHKP